MTAGNGLLYTGVIAIVAAVLLQLWRSNAGVTHALDPEAMVICIKYVC